MPGWTPSRLRSCTKAEVCEYLINDQQLDSACIEREGITLQFESACFHQRAGPRAPSLDELRSFALKHCLASAPRKRKREEDDTTATSKPAVNVASTTECANSLPNEIDARYGLPVLHEVPAENEHGYVYFLRRWPEVPRKTYKGFTTNFRRRLRQHNGVKGAESKRRGAHTTRCDHTRFVWKPELLVRGFRAGETDNMTTQALQFEWWIKHPNGKPRRRKRKVTRQARAAAAQQNAWEAKLVPGHRTHSGQPMVDAMYAILKRLHQPRWSHLEVLWFRPDHRPLTLTGCSLLPPGMREYIVSSEAQQRLLEARAREIPWCILPYDPVTTLTPVQ